MHPEAENPAYWGGQPLEKLVQVFCPEEKWALLSRAVYVVGEEDFTVLMSGGVHSPPEQLCHKGRRFRQYGLGIVTVGQTGAPDNIRSARFYSKDLPERLRYRNVAVLDTFDLFDKVPIIHYGSSLEAISAAATASLPQVKGLILVNPAGVVKQSRLRAGWCFVREMRTRGDPADFAPTPKQTVERKQLLHQMLSGLSPLLRCIASDETVKLLKQVEVPTIVFSGTEDRLFPLTKVQRALEHLPHVKVVPALGFIHSDPNTASKVDWLVTESMRWFAEKGVVH
ncbi:MAG: hypothetical protein WD231_00675 [Candidatus Woykebacteria bacterium]